MNYWKNDTRGSDNIRCLTTKQRVKNDSCSLSCFLFLNFSVINLYFGSFCKEMLFLKEGTSIEVVFFADMKYNTGLRSTLCAPSFFEDEETACFQITNQHGW